jgi:hypothetical protein
MSLVSHTPGKAQAIMGRWGALQLMWSLQRNSSVHVSVKSAHGPRFT